MNTSSDRSCRIELLLRKLPLLPLLAALNLAGAMARFFAGLHSASGVSRRDEPGISILIPERGTPELLAETLSAAIAATAPLTEPTQILVMVNGAEESDYAALRARWPQVEWLFHAKALGYHGAIDRGLRHVRHAWTYLLNSDMRLDPRALVELLDYRRSSVFAISSQIFLVDSARRREETGWTDFNWQADRAEIFDRMPDAGDLARGNLYAGGGSSLFRTAPLRRFVRDARDYAPFYWEDADWGISAWVAGMEVLYCPKSLAWHHHRATINRNYTADEINRVIERNALLFDVRRGWSSLCPRSLIQRIAASDPRTRAELRGAGLAWRAFRSRLATRIAQRRGLRFDTLATHRYYSPGLDQTRTRPRVLVVSPYAISPPVHGGARRVTELVKRLAGSVDFFLLSDEKSLYSAASEKWLGHFRATYLIEGRGDSPLDDMSNRHRLDRHAWPHMRDELKRLIRLLTPDIVQIEFMELARLGERRNDDAKWILALHDVLLDSDRDDPDFDALQHAMVSRFDAITVCSNEDAALLRHPQVTIVANGASRRETRHRPSPDSASLLFMGPFRYLPNRQGILEFLSTAWPDLKNRFPQLRLIILAGELSDDFADIDSRLVQPGVELITRFVEPGSFLDNCTLTINPLDGIRGSSLKLVESLLAGRMCVSTESGARGFFGCGLSGLVIARSIACMGEPIERLLADTAHRHACEISESNLLDAYSWDSIAKRQMGLYQSLMRRQQNSIPQRGVAAQPQFGNPHS